MDYISGLPSESLIIWPIVQFEQDFELLEKLGEGKFGEVFKVCRRQGRGRDRDRGAGWPTTPTTPTTPTHYAAKLMRCERACEKLRVRDEIEILHRFEHKNVVKLVAAHEDSENFIQVLEYLPGGQLFDRIIQSQDDFSEHDISRIICQICEGCQYIATFKIVHLDLKPENIVCVTPQSYHIKLVDFGFARQLCPPSETRVTEGTPEFVSPEVIQYEPISLTTDLWSVGVLTYVLLSGLSPFRGEDNQETFHNIANLLFTFDEVEFEAVSAEAKHFISSLLRVDALERLTATQSLQHPWLRPAADMSAVSASAKSRKTSYDLRRLSSIGGGGDDGTKAPPKNKWQRCANVIHAVQALASGVKEEEEWEPESQSFI